MNLKILSEEHRIVLITIIQYLALTSGIIFPFYFLNNISEQEIFILISVYHIALLFLEIPTGIIATKFGEKVSIIFGLIVGGIVSFLFIVSNTFIDFLILEILTAMGVAFLSGSVSTFTHAVAKKNNIDFLSLRKKTKIAGIISGIVGTMIGGLLLVKGYSLVFTLYGAIFLIGAMLMYGSNINPKPKKNENNVSHIILETKKFLFNSQRTIPAMFIYGLLALESAIYMSFQTEYLQNFGFDEKFLGIFLGLFSLAALLFTKLLPTKSWVLHDWFLLLIGVIFLLVSGSYIMTGSLMIFGLFYLTQVVRPMDIPLEDKILKQAGSMGSSLLSSISFVERIVFIIFSLVIFYWSISSITAVFISSVIIVSIFILVKIFSK